MATSRRVGNYSTSARAVIQASDQIFDAAMSGKPDFTKISKEAIKGRSLERRAVTKAEAEVANAGIKAQTQVRQADIKGDELIHRGKLAGQQYRKAGILAGLGGIATGFVMKADRKAEAKERAARDARDAAQEERWRQLLDREPAKFEFNEKPPEAPGTDKPLPERPAGSIEPTQSSDSPSSASSPSAVKPTPVKGIRSQVYNYLTQHHKMNRNAALGLMANIDRESGFNPSIASGDDGGPGGLFQWKGGRQTARVSELVKAGDWKGQIDYALNEPENLSLVKPGTYQTLQLNSAQEYADWWMNKWERPADRVGGSKKHTEYLSGYNF